MESSITPQRGDHRLVLVTGLPGAGKSTVAEAIARRIGAPVLAHDWAMSGLRRYPAVQDALDRTELGHRLVGWSILQAMARPELRAGRSVVLDGVARGPEIEGCAELASGEGASFVLVSIRCADAGVHRGRVEGRRRGIPDWYELDWASVARSRRSWEEPEAVDLCIDSTAPWEVTEASVHGYFG